MVFSGSRRADHCFLAQHAHLPGKARSRTPCDASCRPGKGGDSSDASDDSDAGLVGMVCLAAHKRARDPSYHICRDPATVASLRRAVRLECPCDELRQGSGWSAPQQWMRFPPGCCSDQTECRAAAVRRRTAGCRRAAGGRRLSISLLRSGRGAAPRLAALAPPLWSQRTCRPARRQASPTWPGRALPAPGAWSSPLVETVGKPAEPRPEPSAGFDTLSRL